MGSWAQAKLSCGQEGSLGWAQNQTGGTGMIWKGSGHSLGRTGALPPLGAASWQEGMPNAGLSPAQGGDEVSVTRGK